MMFEDSHLSDATILQEIDGELPVRDAEQVRAHLVECWACRSRRAELEKAISEFMQLQRSRFDDRIPPADGPRALLKARLAEYAAEYSTDAARPRFAPSRRMRESAWIAAAVLGVVGLVLFRTAVPLRPAHREAAVVFLPDSRFTPGATVLADRLAVCAGPDTKNKSVPVSLQKQVFAEYGIAGGDPAAYEVDYLVTPALGGADDIHNLWPHSYDVAWNARVKDELEDRLRDLVCDGRVDLASAQQEIATDWIAAYKKYFHTDKPIEEYCRRCE